MHPVHVAPQAVAAVDKDAPTTSSHAGGARTPFEVEQRAAEQVRVRWLEYPVHGNVRRGRQPLVSPVRDQMNRVAARGEMTGEREIRHVHPPRPHEVAGHKQISAQLTFPGAAAAAVAPAKYVLRQREPRSGTKIPTLPAT
jgi:hypothetical protein